MNAIALSVLDLVPVNSRNDSAEALRFTTELARCAEQWVGTLEALHPGRIDLEVGRAPGTDGRTALALRRTIQGLSAEDFPEEFADLMAMQAGTIAV